MGSFCWGHDTTVTIKPDCANSPYGTCMSQMSQLVIISIIVVVKRFKLHSYKIPISPENQTVDSHPRPCTLHFSSASLHGRGRGSQARVQRELVQSAQWKWCVWEWKWALSRHCGTYSNHPRDEMKQEGEWWRLSMNSYRAKNSCRRPPSPSHLERDWWSSKGDNIQCLNQLPR